MTGKEKTNEENPTLLRGDVSQILPLTGFPDSFLRHAVPGSGQRQGVRTGGSQVKFGVSVFLCLQWLPLLLLTRKTKK